MAGKISRKEVQKLLGRHIYAVRKDGTAVRGKLVRVSGNTVFVAPLKGKGKQVKTSAIVPLVLFDLLAIGTSPYAYGYGGYSPYGFGYSPYGYGGYGGFW